MAEASTGEKTASTPQKGTAHTHLITVGRAPNVSHFAPEQWAPKSGTFGIFPHLKDILLFSSFNRAPTTRKFSRKRDKFLTLVHSLVKFFSRKLWQSNYGDSLLIISSAKVGLLAPGRPRRSLFRCCSVEVEVGWRKFSSLKERNLSPGWKLLRHVLGASPYYHPDSFG